MKILPAIDLLEGNAVRLRGGERDQATIYSKDPIEMVERWAEAGAERIHIVDLDGAFAGAREQQALVSNLIALSPIPVQVGGGLRTADSIRACLEAGAAGAVVGTAALERPDEVAAICAEHPGSIIVAVDARDGLVTTHGWTETGNVRAEVLTARAADWGASAVLYTDVARDGLETGPNVMATAALVAAMGERIDVIASGGVGTLEHIDQLASIGAASVVVGRALYEERFTLAEAIERAASC